MWQESGVWVIERKQEETTGVLQYLVHTVTACVVCLHILLDF